VERHPGHRHLNKHNKTDTSHKKTYQINFAQAFAKMKQYQAKLWQLSGSPLSQFLKDLMLLMTQYKEQVRPERSFPRKICKFNKRRYWMHYKCTL
jgi:hypothetical protein